MKVEIKQMPAMRLAAIRHVGPYMEIGKVFERLGRVGQESGLLSQPGAQMLAIYYDDPASTPAAQLRSDACIVVPAQTKLPPSLKEQTLPAGKYASTLYVGPYDKLPGIWQQLFNEWLPSSGKQVTGPGYELYLNMPGSVPPAELRTEICVPVA